MSIIEYVIGHNPDFRIMTKAKNILKNGGLVVFPTDTNWQVTCNPYIPKAVEKLYRFKGEESGKHFSLLCHDLSLASKVALIDDKAFRFMRPLVPGPYTFILQAGKEIKKALKASKSDHEVGVRIPDIPLIRHLLSEVDTPLLSTNIKPSMLDKTESNEIYSLLIEEKWEHEFDLILDPGDYEFVGLSTIVNLLDSGLPEIIREGVGAI